MTREDMLRELELLPIWQLREPSSQSHPKAVEAETIVPETIAAQAEPASAPSPKFRMLVSTDKHWMFLLEHNKNAEAEQLLQNMLRAVLVDTHQDVACASLQDIEQLTPKVIVVMGEQEAQQLLAQTQTLDELRGQQHLHHDVPVIVTYSPAHLIVHLADKAKAWEDLCLAKLTIAAL